MEQSLQKAPVQQVFLQFQQYQLLNYLNLIYLCGPVIFIVLCDGGSSLVFFPVARQFSYSITKEMYSPVIGVSLENAFVQQFLQFSIFQLTRSFNLLLFSILVFVFQLMFGGSSGGACHCARRWPCVSCTEASKLGHRKIIESFAMA